MFLAVDGRPPKSQQFLQALQNVLLAQSNSDHFLLLLVSSHHMSFRQSLHRPLDTHNDVRDFPEQQTFPLPDHQYRAIPVLSSGH